MTTEETDSMDICPAEPVKTCDEVLEDAILDLIDLGYENGMTPRDVDTVLEKIIDGRATDVRSLFTVHRNDIDDDENEDCGHG